MARRRSKDEDPDEAPRRRGSRRRAERIAQIEAEKRAKRAKWFSMVAIVVIIVSVGTVAGYVVMNGIGSDDDDEGPQGNPVAVIVTDYGTIEFELFMDTCPETAGNFKSLADKGFYNGVIFHRVINGFMIQGGDPTGTGTGGPGYSIDDEQSALELSHLRGSVSMANSGPDTGGSQFFICVARQSHLDGQHAVFGEVISGMDVVDTIANLDPDYTDSSNKPYNDVIMRQVYIREGGSENPD